MKRYISWVLEVLVILTLLFVADNYLNQEERLINADGKGYYDYLPATFIYHDLNFSHVDTLQTKLYGPNYTKDYLKTVNQKKVNKYFPGAAILWTPFFFGAHYYAINYDGIANGYSWPYQRAIYFAAIFYLWIGLMFLRKTLILLDVKLWIVFLIQLLFTLGTPLLYYVQFEPAYTHVYSFALISSFTYFSFKFIQNQKLKDVVIAGFILGFIVIVRPVNLLALLIIPLYFHSFNEFIMFVSRLFTEYLKPLLIAFIVFTLVISLVPFLWHFQTGQFFIWGYQEEGFNFLDPEIFNFLFSLKRGAFVHTPLLLIATIGGIYSWIKTHKIYNALSFLIILYLIIYILSSWWSWHYGSSFGSRPTIDFYIIFAIALGQFLNKIRFTIAKVLVSVGLVVFIPINIIQAYQYHHYIMDWSTMTFEKFNIIGLHTEDKYKGIFFMEEFTYSMGQVIYAHDFNLEQPINLTPEKSNWFPEFRLDSTINIEQINYVHIRADITYNNGTSEVILSINNPEKENIYWHGKNIFSATKTENTREVCNYYYKIPPQELENFFTLVISSNSDNITIHSLDITMLNR